MSEKVTWFLLGALAASVFWGVILAIMNRQLVDAFFGFAGHS